MSLENVIKESFFHRVRRSVASKVMPVIAAGMFTFSGCEVPGEKSYDHPEITEIYKKGMNIQTGLTNKGGKIYFNEESDLFNGQKTTEVIEISVIDDQSAPVPNAEVFFFDGKGFEAYHINHEDFTPFFHIFNHNSSHVLRLTMSPLQSYSYTGSSNENSKEAAETFAEYTETWDDRGCRDREWLVTNIDLGVLIFKSVAGINTHASPFIDTLVNKIKGVMRQDQMARVLNFIPFEHGIYATTTLMTLDLRDDNGCYETQTCIPHSDRGCSNGNVYWIDSCGEIEELYETCEPDKQCSNKICHSKPDDRGCEDECGAEGATYCSNNQVFLCDYYNGNLCREVKLSEVCGSGQECEDGKCVAGPDCSPTPDKYCEGNKVVTFYECENRREVQPCSSDEKCENGECVNQCSPLPDGWIMCACPEIHHLLCHPNDKSCDE
ncbi:hypothetical protein COV17_03100 [Candidatus Woesearchaeota archaeon CG10_big_fil_rev_8_21_14_0_10_36_11]|nr:MAG: hypothetical protein COV17_03100 [Candidatus Woesearchaeota archaeon CG10_big_fil_rev_8_21_14_0_10_36_11]